MKLHCPPSKVSLRFFHPNIDPAEITESLGIVPSYSWRAGEPRMTPKGRVLGGNRDKSYWCGDLQEVVPPEDLSGLLQRWISLLEPHAELLRELAPSGGRIELYIFIPGNENAGDTLRPDLLARIGALGIELGIEVCP